MLGLKRIDEMKKEHIRELCDVKEEVNERIYYDGLVMQEDE